MRNNQIMGFIASLLFVIAILLRLDINRHHTIGDSIHETAQNMKEKMTEK